MKYFIAFVVILVLAMFTLIGVAVNKSSAMTDDIETNCIKTELMFRSKSRWSYVYDCSNRGKI